MAARTETSMQDQAIAPQPLPGILATMRLSTFRTFIIGAFLSNLGTWMQSVALSWLILQATDSAFWVSMVPAAQFGPVLLLGIPGGVMVDRFDRKMLLMLAQVLMMVTAAALAWVAWAGNATLAIVIPLVMLGGSAMAIHAPAFHSLISDMMPRQYVPAAVAINSSQFSFSRVIGPAIGGYIVHLSGPPLAFAINAVSFFAVIAALLMISVPKHHDATTPIGRRSFTEAFRAARASQPIITTLVVAIALSLLSAPIVALLPVMSRNVLSRGADVYGHLFASFGLGTAIGSLASTRFVHGSGYKPLVIVGGVIQGLLIGVFAVSTDLIVSLVAMLGFGIAHGGVLAATASGLQMAAPAQSRGRVMSLFIMAFAGMFPIGSVIAGVIADEIGAPLTLAWTGVLVVLVSLAGIRFRQELSRVRFH